MLKGFSAAQVWVLRLASLTGVWPKCLAAAQDIFVSAVQFYAC